MFTTLIVQPIFNLLVLIYALLPGHNFGLAIIIFTIIIRLLMWPLVKKQLHHAKAMRELQPEIKRIKKQTKGDRQKESMMIMELYKEREINPFASIGLLLVQLPIFIALYSGLNKLINDPTTIVSFSYPFIQNLGSVKELATDINLFDSTLFGFVDLTRAAIGDNGTYIPALLIVTASAVTQYFQSKQLTASDKDAKGLKQILKDAGSGKQADQSEVNAAVGRSTRFFIPGMVFLFTVSLPSALSLYWLTSGLVALWQQKRVLGQDEKELEEASEKKPSAKSRAKSAQEATIVSKKTKKTTKANKKPSGKKSKKRRK
jgi:YidC/Oxa1 family membrane protein insertase